VSAGHPERVEQSDRIVHEVGAVGTEGHRVSHRVVEIGVATAVGERVRLDVENAHDHGIEGFATQESIAHRSHLTRVLIQDETVGHVHD